MTRYEDICAIELIKRLDIAKDTKGMHKNGICKITRHFVNKENGCDFQMRDPEFRNRTVNIISDTLKLHYGITSFVLKDYGHITGSEFYYKAEFGWCPPSNFWSTTLSTFKES